MALMMTDGFRLMKTNQNADLAHARIVMEQICHEGDSWSNNHI